MGISPYISWYYILIPALIIIYLAIANHKRSCHALGKGYPWNFTIPRILVVLLLSLLLLHPYTETNSPAKEHFRIALLADTSHSMQVKDCDNNSSRLDVLKQLFATEGNFLDELQNNYQTELWNFSKTTTRNKNKIFKTIPGSTSIGTALNDMYNSTSVIPLGAVVLLSDGNNNTTPKVSEVCKKLENEQIPVTCIGIGSTNVPGDISIKFNRENITTPEHQPANVTATVENTFSNPIEVLVELSDTLGQTQQQTITVAAGKEQEVTFNYKPIRSGRNVLKVKATPKVEDPRPDTNTDFLILNVEKPPVFKLLYLGGHLGWEFKFLQLMVKQHEQMELATVIKTGEDVFFTAGFTKDAKKSKGYPESTELINSFDAIILDTRALPHLPESTYKNVINFVDNRGGGLLLTGPLSKLPEGMREVTALVAEREAVSGNRYLSVIADSAIWRKSANLLKSSQGLKLDGGDPTPFQPEKKAGAQIAAEFNDNLPALAIQRYGAGKVATITVENTWRWQLKDDINSQRYQTFWNSLLRWLGSTTNKQFKAAADGSKAGLGDEVSLNIDVNGTDFLPAPNANINLQITSPDGESTEYNIDPSPDMPGRFTGFFLPEETGEYKVSYDISIDDKKYSYDSRFLVRHTGVETADTRYREDILRDISRITGGKFYQYNNPPAATDIPLSVKTPKNISRFYWAETWPVLILLILLISFEWLMRRRIGLT